MSGKGCGLVLGVVAVFIIIGSIINASGGSQPSSGVQDEFTGQATTDAALPTQAAEVPVTPAPTPPPAPQPTDPPKPAGPASSMDEGTFVVGTDIVAGTYKTSGPNGDNPVGCYWERLKDTSGNFESIIANDISKGPTTITISRSDGAFKTTACKTWHKVS